MNISVSTTAFAMKRSGKPVLVQNLGPGLLYVSFDPAVSSTSGIQLDVFDAIELPGASHGSIYFLSASTSDVRLLGGAALPDGVVAPTGPFIQNFLLDDLLNYDATIQSFFYFSADDPVESKLVLSEASNAPINYSVALSSTDVGVSFGFTPVTGTINPGATSAEIIFNGAYAGSASSFPITAVVTLSSADTAFDGLTATKEFTVNVPAAVFSGYSGALIEGGSAVNLLWTVNTAPTADVTVNYASSTAELSFTSGTILSGATGTVTAGTVQLSDNGIDEGTIILTATTSSADPNYDGLIIFISAFDNPVLVREVEPVPSGTFVPAALDDIYLEGVNSTTVNYALAYTPSANVDISLSFANSKFTVSPSTLTFTTGNFATSQQITVNYIGSFPEDDFDQMIAEVAATSADTSRIGDTDTIRFVRYNP